MEQTFCNILKGRHPYVIASMLVALEKSQFSCFDIYDKMLEIFTFIQWKPAPWVDGFEGWTLQRTVLQSRTQDIRNFMNYSSRPRADFSDNFTFYGKRGKTPFFEISDKNRRLAEDTWKTVEEIERITLELDDEVIVWGRE
jgi:hypothetical protein